MEGSCRTDKKEFCTYERVMSQIYKSCYIHTAAHCNTRHIPGTSMPRAIASEHTKTLSLPLERSDTISFLLFCGSAEDISVCVRVWERVSLCVQIYLCFFVFVLFDHETIFLGRYSACLYVMSAHAHVFFSIYMCCM